ncbi:unnamed protein product [Rhizophagus irregularis]|nr:unnamed protein product [Rhizophagus irregularis]
MLAELKTQSTTSFSATPLRQAESFIDFDELLSVYDIPLQVVKSFIDFDELLSVYDVPLLPYSIDNSTMIVDSDDRPYDFDDDSHFFLSSFNDSSFLNSLSESTVSLPIQPLSISSFSEFSKFERRRKWKIYCSSLPPVVIFISWIFLTCSLWFQFYLRIMDGLLKLAFSCSINRFINLFSSWPG